MSNSALSITEEEARFLYWLMADERLRLLDERRYAKAGGAVLTSYQQLTGRIRTLRSRLELLADRHQWDLGEPEYQNQ